MPANSLTPRQVDIIQRLRDEGHGWLADTTKELWLRGLTYFIPMHAGLSEQLRADFELGNADATKET